METSSDLLMLHAVSAMCRDCAGERLFLPVEDGYPGELCCTSCDAAVLLLTVGSSRPEARSTPDSGVAGAA